MKEFKIYGLKLNDSDEIKYIGRTGSNLKKRLASHFSDANKPKYNFKNVNWLRKYKNNVEIVLIEDNIETSDEANLKEIEYIKLFRSFGANLNNTTKGGEGVVGMVRTEEYRKRLSDSLKGRIVHNKGISIAKKIFICSNCEKEFERYKNKKDLDYNNHCCDKKCEGEHKTK